MEQSTEVVTPRSPDPELERTYLVNFCGHLTGEPLVAEDLAQETLIRAWRHGHQLRDPGRRDAWLKAIARNLCRRWLRDHKPVLTGPTTRGTLSSSETSNDIEPADEFDLEIEIDRAELARLLDRAMALLPAETRAVLVERYVEESPQVETALRLGLSEGAVAMRLQRGKLALRRILTTTFRDDVAEYGLCSEETGEQWRKTRIWCPFCGQLRLEGIFVPKLGLFRLRCSACGRLNDSQSTTIFTGVISYRAALLRLQDWSNRLYRHSLTHRTVQCYGCGATLILRKEVADGARRLSYVCDRCPFKTFNGQDFNILALPESRRFWREHPRMRGIKEREVEIDGSPAIVAGFESSTDRARLEIIYTRDSLHLIAVNGDRPRI